MGTTGKNPGTSNPSPRKHSPWPDTGPPIDTPSAKLTVPPPAATRAWAAPYIVSSGLFQPRPELESEPSGDTYRVTSCSQFGLPPLAGGKNDEPMLAWPY